MLLDDVVVDQIDSKYSTLAFAVVLVVFHDTMESYRILLEAEAVKAVAVVVRSFQAVLAAVIRAVIAVVNRFQAVYLSILALMIL